MKKTLSVILVFITAATLMSKPMNVLFIGVDDLRPQLNSYGFHQMKTPNFDRLAAMGVQFNRAYVQQAVCAASRASFLTGCRPDSTGVNYPYSPWFSDVFIQQYKPIAQYFAEQGFYTRTLGKIHHGAADKGTSEPHFGGSAPDFHLPENQFEGPRTEWTRKVRPWEHADLPDSAYGDGQIADETIATIRRAVNQDKPFFISPGFKKPHLPFVCPKQYYDLYSEDDIKLAVHNQRGPNQPEVTTTDSTGASKWWKYPMEGIDDENARQLIHSYYACVSFVDAQIGKILDEMEAQGLMDSTIIIVWSDHGWHLGDHGMWGKSTNYEWSTRSPTFAYVPGMRDSGRQCDALIEYVDLFPTALDLCGLPVPGYMEGTSFAPLLDDVSRPWKSAAFSQFPRGNNEGFTMRTKDFRYTQWRTREGELFYEELYDNREHLLESENLVANPEYHEILQSLRKQFSMGWKAALPAGVVNHSNLPRGDDSWYYQGKGSRTDADVARPVGETSETKPWIKDFFQRNPSADKDGDGILTKDEVNAFKAGI